mgnify:CR=1 FL=1
MPPSARLYRTHLETLTDRYDAALERAGAGAVLVGAGVPVPIHRDDQDHPYRAEPLFLQWAPLAAHPGSALLYRPGRKPVLLVHEPDDFWHQAAPVPGGPWERLLDIRVVRYRAALAKACASVRRLALVGDPAQWKRLGLEGTPNPKALLTSLDYDRAWKTGWEVACIEEATRLGLAGHRAVQTGFAAGLSEYELGLLFLAACGQTDAELPYPAIVAMNRNAATLHYQHRERRRLSRKERHSLLLDAGCTYLGYASDITRTHAARRGEFAGMVRDMHDAQQRLCRLVRPGIAFPELQLEAHREVAGLLARWDLVRLSVDEMLAARVTDHFLPHGLGHLLGLQVHDVGGDLANAEGGKLPRPERFPRLRLTRLLEPGMVLTIEPGIYFIDTLLNRLRLKRAIARRVRWAGLAALRQCGGIRMEDNVLIPRSGHRNLTRELEAT